MPTCAAAFDHWCFRCSVGATIVTFAIVRSASSSLATRSANVVLPAPGVATARKSCGAAARYRDSATRCQARRGRPPFEPDWAIWKAWDTRLPDSLDD